MSVIFDVMVVSDFMGETRRMEEVNRELHHRDPERHQQFRPIPVDNHAGGSKVWCEPVWAGAFNHLVPEEIHAAICAAEWPYPESVLVIETGGDYDIRLRARSVKELRREIAGDPPPVTRKHFTPDEWPFADEDPPDPL